MEKLPKRFVERVARNLKNYQAITEAQRKRDVSEADTVTVVKDSLPIFLAMTNMSSSQASTRSAAHSVTSPFVSMARCAFLSR